MKKTTLSVLTLFILFGLSGCGSGSDTTTPTPTTDVITNDTNITSTNDINTTINVPIDDGSFIFQGKTYNTVTSPYTERIWLDRNLGANEVCTSKNDTNCYGDYYQWGRLTDGHEKSDSNTTMVEASSSINNNSNFILADDWYSTDFYGNDRIYNWSRIDGSGVCPVGFRVPTYDELAAEFLTVTNADSAFNKFLKLPTSGMRSQIDGTIKYTGEGGRLWSNTPTTGSFIDYMARIRSWSTTEVNGGYSNRGSGSPIRCIKD